MSFKYRPDLDGLRAIAVLSVIFFHLKFSFAPGGFVGVDVFFVISGFLITSLLLAEIERTKTINLFGFYARRMRRLLPALFMLIALTLAAWSLVFIRLNAETSQYLASIRYGIFGFANIFFRHNIGNYFDASTAQMPLLHLWSLGIEEQFYFIWPSLILVCFVLFKTDFRKKLFIFLLVLSIGAFLNSLWDLYTGHQTRVFYLSQFRAWELAIGALIAISSEESRRPDMLSPRSRGALSALGLALILGSVMLFAEGPYFPGWRALVPTLGAALLILFNTNGTLLNKLLSSKPFVGIGLISYGLYLFHWPLISFAHIYSIRHTLTPLDKGGIIALAFLISGLSYFLIETRVKRSQTITALGPKTIVLAGFVLCSLIFVSTYAAGAFNKKVIAREPYKTLYAETDRRVGIPEECRGTIENFSYRKCFSTHAGSPSRAPLVFMWGDSYAYATAELTTPLTSKNGGVNTVVLSNYGRPPLLDLDYHWSPKGLDWTAQTNAINNNVYREIRQMTKDNGNVSVVLSARWNGYKTVLDKDRTASGTLPELQEKLQSTIKKLTSAGVKRFLIILPYPEFDYVITQCLALHAPQECYIDRGAFEKDRAPVVAALKNAVKQLPNVRMIDPLPFECEQEKCFSLLPRRDVPAVWDDSHPTSEASRLFGSSVETDLSWLVSATAQHHD